MTTTPSVGWLTSDFGPRKPPLKPDGTYGTAYHNGTDIGGPPGTPVVAPESGLVTAVNRTSARGIYVVVDHGRFRTLHQHLDSAAVTVGQWVTEGQHIGVMGSTGGVARHLHTEVHDGTTPIDPVPWYRARGVTLGVAPSEGGGGSTQTPTQEEDDVALTQAEKDALAKIPLIFSMVSDILTKERRHDLRFLYFRTPDNKPAVAQPGEMRYAIAPNEELLEQHRWMMKQVGLVVEGTSVKDWDDIRTAVLGLAENGDVILDPEVFITQVEWKLYPGGRWS